MGTGTGSIQQTTPGEDTSSDNSSPNIAEKASPRYVLPKDLSNAIKQLTDRELDALSAAVSVEQQRRGRNPPPNENAQKRRVEEASASMSIGKINAVRAAFKAGLKPPQIARQFRLSQADIRKALSDTKSGRGSRE